MQGTATAGVVRLVPLWIPVVYSVENLTTPEQQGESHLHLIGLYFVYSLLLVVLPS